MTEAARTDRDFDMFSNAVANDLTETHGEIRRMQRLPGPGAPEESDRGQIEVATGTPVCDCVG